MPRHPNSEIHNKSVQYVISTITSTDGRDKNTTSGIPEISHTLSVDLETLQISKIRMNVSVLSLHGYRIGLRSPQTFLPHTKETLARVSQIKHSTWNPLQESQAKLSHACSLLSCSACNSHFHSLDRVAWESVQWSFVCRTHTAEI